MGQNKSRQGLSRHEQRGHHQPRGGGHKHAVILVLGSREEEVG